jgi:hypothetical protein
LKAEGGAFGLVGGLVLAGLRAGRVVAAAAAAPPPPPGVGGGGSEAAAGSAATAAAEAEKGANGGDKEKVDRVGTTSIGDEMLCYLRVLAGSEGCEGGSISMVTSMGSRVVGWQAHSAWFLTKASTDYGCYVGCSNPTCENMDKMSESGLDLKRRGNR